jgi:hypothetical protein
VGRDWRVRLFRLDDFRDARADCTKSDRAAPPAASSDSLERMFQRIAQSTSLGAEEAERRSEVAHEEDGEHHLRRRRRAVAELEARPSEHPCCSSQFVAIAPPKSGPSQTEAKVTRKQILVGFYLDYTSELPVSITNKFSPSRQNPASSVR